MKSSSIQKISKEGLELLKDCVISVAEEEGLKAHADSVRLRFE
jgi:histidinol dehydrogenase